MRTRKIRNRQQCNNNICPFCIWVPCGTQVFYTPIFTQTHVGQFLQNASSSCFFNLFGSRIILLSCEKEASKIGTGTKRYAQIDSFLTLSQQRLMATKQEVNGEDFLQLFGFDITKNSFSFLELFPSQSLLVDVNVNKEKIFLCLCTNAASDMHLRFS